MPQDLGTVTLTLASKDHSVADLATLSDMLEGLTMTGIRAEIFYAKSEPGQRARKFLEEYRKDPRRWWPDRSWPFEPLSGNDWRTHPDTYNLRASLVRRLIQRHAPDLYHDLFSFANIRRLEHHSPLLIEMAILAGPLLIAPLLVLAFSRVASDMRRHAASADIDEALPRTKNAEADHTEAKAKIMDYLAQSAAKQLAENHLELPKEALVEVAKSAYAPVVDLSGSDLLQDTLAAVAKSKGNGDSKDGDKKREA